MLLLIPVRMRTLTDFDAFQNTGDYGWLVTPPDRLPVYARSPDPGLVPGATALPDGFVPDNDFLARAACEIKLRELLVDRFENGLGLALSDVQAVLDDVRATECAIHEDIWDPVLSLSSVPRVDENLNCPVVDSGVHLEGDSYTLQDGTMLDFAANTFVLEDGTMPEFAADTFVLHWDPKHRGEGLGSDSNARSGVDYTTVMGIGGSVSGSRTGGVPPPSYESNRVQPSLPVNGERCWMYDGVLGWTGAGLVPDNDYNRQFDYQDPDDVITDRYNSDGDFLGHTYTADPSGSDEFKQRFLGYVDSRPSPVFVMPWPFWGASGGLWQPSWANYYAFDFVRHVARDFKKIRPSDGSRTCVNAADSNSFYDETIGYGLRNVVDPSIVGSYPDGYPVQQGSMYNCWVTYKWADEVPGLSQVVRAPSGSGLSTATFPLLRVLDVRSRSNPDLDGLVNDSGRSASFAQRYCVDVNEDSLVVDEACLEPLTCVYQDHRGMLKTNFTLQEFPQSAGEVYGDRMEDPASVLYLEDDFGNRYDTLLVTANDTAHSEEGDLFHAMNSENWGVVDGVLHYEREDGFAKNRVALRWVGYRINDKGLVEYTDSLGYQSELNPDLIGGCRPICPYINPEPASFDERGVWSTADRYKVRVHGGAEDLGLDNECKFFGSGPVDCSQSKEFLRRDSSLKPFGASGFLYDLPYPYCPYLMERGSTTMEDYVLPVWSNGPVALKDSLPDSDRPIVLEDGPDASGLRSFDHTTPECDLTGLTYDPLLTLREVEVGELGPRNLRVRWRRDVDATQFCIIVEGFFWGRLAGRRRGFEVLR